MAARCFLATRLAAWVLMGLCAGGGAPRAAGAGDPPPITVFGAASLTNVLQDLGDAFTRQSSITVRFSFAASSALARQIENGAPADVFFSADAQWMDYLEQRNLIQRPSRHDVIGNRLVLIAPAGTTATLKIEPHFALATALGTGRLAMADPSAVPAGRYAKQALTALGVWQQIEPRFIGADSVRSALAFVDRGEAPLGIVYETDALADKHVRTVDVFAPESHAPIVYPIALTRSAKPDAERFLAFVRGPAGAAAFKAYGFTALR